MGCPSQPASADRNLDSYVLINTQASMHTLLSPHLSFENSKPELLCLHTAFRPTFPLIALIQGSMLITPAISKAWSFIGAKQTPLRVCFDPLHEQVCSPQAIEKVSGTGLQA